MGHSHDWLGRYRFALQHHFEQHPAQTRGQSIQPEVVLGATDKAGTTEDLNAERNDGGEDEKAEEPDFDHEVSEHFVIGDL
jgi:hypothetical protein